MPHLNQSNTLNLFTAFFLAEFTSKKYLFDDPSLQQVNWENVGFDVFLKPQACVEWFKTSR